MPEGGIRNSDEIVPLYNISWAASLYHLFLSSLSLSPVVIFRTVCHFNFKARARSPFFSLHLRGQLHIISVT